MKLNNKGFAISSIMYIILVLAVILMVVTLALLGNRKLIIDRIKQEVFDIVYGDRIMKNGKEVYFDVKTGKSCINYHEDNSKTGYNGLEVTKTTENQNSCLKFYAFLDDGSMDLNLILDHNTTATVAWNSTNNNEYGPKEIKENLYNDTKEWKGIITPLDYKYNHSRRAYTIEYSKAPKGKTEPYKARLITAQEIAKITGASREYTLNWKEESSTSNYYLDGLKGTDVSWQTQISNTTNQSEYYWLYDRTNSCTEYGCKVSDISNFGYWTSSAHAEYSFCAWRVDYRGYVTYGSNVYGDGAYGVRPVITVLKSKLEK